MALQQRYKRCAPRILVANEDDVWWDMLWVNGSAFISDANLGLHPSYKRGRCLAGIGCARDWSNCLSSFGSAVAGAKKRVRKARREDGIGGVRLESAPPMLDERSAQIIDMGIGTYCWTTRVLILMGLKKNVKVF